MGGILRFLTDETNEKNYESSTLKSYKFDNANESDICVFLETSLKTYGFQLSTDAHCISVDHMIEFLSEHLEAVLKGTECFEVTSFPRRPYVAFYFYTDFNEEPCGINQFSGWSIKEETQLA